MASDQMVPKVKFMKGIASSIFPEREAMKAIVIRAPPTVKPKNAHKYVGLNTCSTDLFCFANINEVIRQSHHGGSYHEIKGGHRRDLHPGGAPDLRANGG